MKQPQLSQAARKALDLYRSLRHPAGEAQTFLANSIGPIYVTTTPSPQRCDSPKGNFGQVFCCDFFEKTCN